MMSIEKALECAKKELAMCVYQGETSPYPGIAAINNDRAEWLSQLIRAAESAEKSNDKPVTEEEKLSIQTPLGRLETLVGGNPAELPEICTYLVREDGVEINLVSCEVDIKQNVARAYLYGDTGDECWTDNHTWAAGEINIK